MKETPIQGQKTASSSIKRKAASSKPSPLETPPGEVKDRIYAAALSLFGRKGYAAVSVREICREAQTTPPMVYYYFKNKRELYLSILQESTQWRRRELDKALRSQGTPLDRLRGVLEAWCGIGQEPVLRELRLFFLRELFGLGSEQYKSSAENSDRLFRHALKTVIQEGVEQGAFRPVRVEMTVLAIAGIVNTFNRRMALGVPITLEDGIEQVMDTFVYGLAQQKPAKPDKLASHTNGLTPAVKTKRRVMSK